ncbi:MAG TPA: hypothetical protein ENN03_08235 [bacterium]|nr:hypothetical protein [bacterium]
MRTESLPAMDYTRGISFSQIMDETPHSADSLQEKSFAGFLLGVKRLMDFSFSMFFLLAAWPLLLLVSTTVKLSSPGPVFFRQERVGLRGRSFLIYKFRTMFHTDSQKDHKAYIRYLLHEGIGAESKPDLLERYINHVQSYVTPVGALLRATSLDELPQMINILSGRMSLVGPRPHPVYEVQAYKPWYFRRLEVKPGLTGWSKINLRLTPENYEESILYDLWYVDHWNLLLDLKIILMTIPYVLSMRDVY